MAACINEMCERHYTEVEEGVLATSPLLGAAPFRAGLKTAYFSRKKTTVELALMTDLAEI